MRALRNLPEPCRICRKDWPAYIEAYLDGTAGAASYRSVRAHLAVCPNCAAGFAKILALVAWREAQEPFNVGCLPLMTMCLPHFICAEDLQ